MDIGTHAYSTECHFFRDSAQAGTIEWREALPNAEPLPFNSGIVNLDWELDKDWIQQPYGEIWGAPRTFNPARPPIGLRGVPCGSVRDFQIGAIYDDERVPIQYTKFGYPLCCGAVVGMRGGAGASGLSVVATNTFIDPTEGGVDLGGEAGDVAAYADATEGGVELGGEAGDVFTPGTPAPGSDCASAPSLAPGVTYAWTGPTDGSVEQWWSWVIPIAGTYRITGTGFSTGTVIGHGLYGSGCDHIFGDMGLLGVLDCMNATLGAGSVVYLVVSGSSGTPYTFVLEEGSC